MKLEQHWSVCTSLCINVYILDTPENIEATAATTKDKITLGPATLWATIPATRYMPVPTQLPTPSDVRSRVVSTCRRKDMTMVNCPRPVRPDQGLSAPVDGRMYVIGKFLLEGVEFLFCIIGTSITNKICYLVSQKTICLERLLLNALNRASIANRMNLY